MNFKTTIILILLLAGIGGYMFFTSETVEKPAATVVESGGEQKLFDFPTADVTRLSITPADGSAIVLEKSGANWRLVQPVAAAGENFQIDTLVHAIAGLRTRGQVDPKGKDAETIGLTSPRYSIEIIAGAKTTKLAVGNRAAVGDHLYVQVAGRSQADVVAAGLTETLDQPVNTYRRKKLVDVSPADVRRLSITTPTAKLAIEKIATTWQVTAPTSFAADPAAVTDLLAAVINAQTVDFVAEDAAAPEKYGFDQPEAVITLFSAAPAPQPATQPTTAVHTTLKLGRYDGVLEKNVFATIEGSPSVVKIPADVLHAVVKSPLELRDKRVVDLKPADVTRIALTIDRSPGKSEVKQVVIDRKHAPLQAGPPLPASQPTATKPAESPVQWESKSDPAMTINDARVETLLANFHPLHAESFVESAPATTQPATRYELTITTRAADGSGPAGPVDHRISFVDAGGDSQSVVGTYNGVTFHAARSVLSALEGDFAAPSAPIPLLHGQTHPSTRE